MIFGKLFGIGLMLYGVVALLIVNADFLCSKNLQLFPAGIHKLGALAGG